MINLFLVAGVKHLMVTHLSNTLNAWILFCKTWMVTENCYYKKLLKDNLRMFLRYFFCKDTHNLSKSAMIMLNFVKFYHCCILHDYLPFIFLTFTSQFNCYNTIDVLHMRSWNCEIVYWLLSASTKSAFTGGQFLGKNAPFSSATHFKFSSN